METLIVLGIEVSSQSFSFLTKSTDDKGNISSPPSNEYQDSGDVEEAAAARRADSDVHEHVENDLEGGEASDAMEITEKTEDVVEVFEGLIVGKASHDVKTTEVTEDMVEAFEGITVGKAFHDVESSLSTSCKVHWQDRGEIKDVQVKISKLKMGEENSLHIKEDTQCDRCSKKFSNKDNLNTHVRTVHNKDKPYQCNQCFKKFGHKHHLTRHIEVVHKKVKPYQCSQCLKKCSNKTNLNRHIEIGHNKAKPYQCSHCLKKFCMKHSLRDHILIKHNGEQPHSCPQPGRAGMFGLKSTLKRHMIKVHNVDKTFPCVQQNCDEKFLDCRKLYEHLRSVH